MIWLILIHTARYQGHYWLLLLLWRHAHYSALTPTSHYCPICHALMLNHFTRLRRWLRWLLILSLLFSYATDAILFYHHFTIISTRKRLRPPRLLSHTYTPCFYHIAAITIITITPDNNAIIIITLPLSPFIINCHFHIYVIIHYYRYHRLIIIAIIIARLLPLFIFIIIRQFHYALLLCHIWLLLLPLLLYIIIAHYYHATIIAFHRFRPLLLYDAITIIIIHHYIIILFFATYTDCHY